MNFRKFLRTTALGLTLALGASSTFAADGTLVRIATVPAGAEVAGLAVNAQGELFFNAQHPGNKAAYKEGGPAAEIGYMHGVDINTYSGGHVAIPAEAERARVHVAAGEYVILAKSGDKLGNGQVVGGVYDHAGKLMFVSNDVDFNAFIPLGDNEAYLYTAFEGAGRRGVSGVSRLKLNRTDGKWQADLAQSKMLDLQSIDGAWVLCFGTVSPWGTPILSEEYYFYATRLWNHPNDHDEDERPSFKKGNDISYHQAKRMNEYLGRPSNPYRYGYNIEIKNPRGDKVQFVRHYVHGRFSHENVVVMPDRKTIYQSDDDSAKYNNKKYNSNSGGVFFKFVADKPDDLSAGTLYAADLTQDAGSDPRKTGFTVTWIELAHGTNAQVEKWVAEYEGFSTKDYKEGETNYISDAEIYAWAEGKTGKDLNGNGKVESAKDDRVAFLESRKAAAVLGAANDWNKMEGVATDGKYVYLAASNITETMDKAWGDVHWSTGVKDESKPGDIALDKEACGAVYRGPVDGAYDLKRLEPYVVGRDLGNKQGCDLENIASPDNILSLSSGALLIAEDAGKRQHPVDFLWLKK